MPLYTFILEYKGGTYISQVSASSFKEAPRVWANAFDSNTKPEYQKLFEPDFDRKLIESLEPELITPLTGLLNTWAWSAYRLESPATIHFTRTAEQE